MKSVVRQFCWIGSSRGVACDPGWHSIADVSGEGARWIESRLE